MKLQQLIIDVTFNTTFSQWLTINRYNHIKIDAHVVKKNDEKKSIIIRYVRLT